MQRFPVCSWMLKCHFFQLWGGPQQIGIVVVVALESLGNKQNPWLCKQAGELPAFTLGPHFKVNLPQTWAVQTKHTMKNT